MPTKKETLDLTKKSGEITQVQQPATSALPPFLQEVTMSGVMTAFYFKSTTAIQNGVKDFEVATLKLPAGFRYVDYNNGENPPTWENFQGTYDYDLFANLVIFKAKGEKTSFHLCEEETKDPITGNVSQSYGGSLHGCSELLMPFNDDSFILFYYDAGQIYTNSDILKGKIDITKLPDGVLGYYLIPMLTSERNVIYYFITVLKNDPNAAFTILNRLKTEFQDSKYRKCIAISKGLQLNDKLGIFVTDGIEKPKKS